MDAMVFAAADEASFAEKIRQLYQQIEDLEGLITRAEQDRETYGAFSALRTMKYDIAELRNDWSDRYEEWDNDLPTQNSSDTSVRFVDEEPEAISESEPPAGVEQPVAHSASGGSFDPPRAG